jgi:hypothetical protein
MSTPAKFFAAYFGIGMLLLLVAIISDKTRSRARTLEHIVDEVSVGAGLLIFIALLWPVWLVGILARKNEK